MIGIIKFLISRFSFVTSGAYKIGGQNIESSSIHFVFLFLFFSYSFTYLFIAFSSNALMLSFFNNFRITLEKAMFFADKYLIDTAAHANALLIIIFSASSCVSSPSLWSTIRCSPVSIHASVNAFITSILAWSSRSHFSKSKYSS